MLRACDRTGVPLTFRSGGTSPSGQELTDSVLVDTRKRFQAVEVLDNRMLHLEPTASAAAPGAAELSTRAFAAYASCNRTCELAMTRATGQPYWHILEFLEESTREAGLHPGG